MNLFRVILVAFYASSLSVCIILFHTWNLIYTHRRCRFIAFIFVFFLLIQKLPVVSELVAHRQTTRMQPAMNADRSSVAGLMSHWKKRWVAVNDSAWAASPCCSWPPEVKVAWNATQRRQGREPTFHLCLMTWKPVHLGSWIDEKEIGLLPWQKWQHVHKCLTWIWHDVTIYFIVFIPVLMTHHSHIHAYPHYDIHAYPHDYDNADWCNNIPQTWEAGRDMLRLWSWRLHQVLHPPRPWSTSRRNRFAKDLPLLLGQKCKTAMSSWKGSWGYFR